MVLHTTPYSSACLHFLDGLSWSLVFPCYWLLDRLLASCVATSLEKRQRSQDPCSFLTLCVLISAPLYLLLLLASLPFALVGFIIWAPLQAIRQPYLYTYRRLVWTLVLFFFILFFQSQMRRLVTFISLFIIQLSIHLQRCTCLSQFWIHSSSRAQRFFPNCNKEAF